MAVYAHRTEDWLEQRFGYTPKLWRMESASSEWSPDWISMVEIGLHPTASGSDGLRNLSWRIEFKCWQCGGECPSQHSPSRHLQPEVCSPTETALWGLAQPVSLIQIYTINSASLSICMQPSSLSAQLCVTNKPSFWVLQFLHMSAQTTTQLSVHVLGCLSFF